MTPGTVLFDANFRFKDGATGKKIFVVLNNGQSGLYVTVKTTSRGDRYGITHGCQILDRFPNFFLVKGSCFLKESTWIQLDAYYEFEFGKLTQKVLSGTINRIGILSLDQTIDLLVCTTHSDDLTIFQEKEIQATLAALQAKGSP